MHNAKPFSLDAAAAFEHVHIFHGVFDSETAIQMQKLLKQRWIANDSCVHFQAIQSKWKRRHI